MSRNIKHLLLATFAALLIAAAGGWYLKDRLLPPAAAAAELDPVDRDRALAFLDALDRGDFAAAETMLAPAAREALSGGKLEEVWTVLPTQVGERKERTPPRGESIQGTPVVTVTLRHALLALDARIHFDADGLIDGFRIVPARAAPSAPVQNERFSEHPSSVAGLSATLSLPRGDGPFPGVVLVHGSGAHDQDETIGPNKPFRDLAHGLAERGVAVLRFAKRNHERPQDFGPDATVEQEVVDDAVAAVAVLRASKGVDPDRVHVLGHSLGAMVAPRIGGRAEGVAGLILLAAPARPLHHVVPQQIRYLAALDGETSAAEAEAIATAERQREAIDAMLAGGPAPEDWMLGIGEAYWRDIGAYDPVADLRRQALPAFILQGERDYQVTEVDDYARWFDGLAGREHTRLTLYPGLNHLFMPGEGAGNPQEYMVEGRVAGTVIADIADWVNGR